MITISIKDDYLRYAGFSAIGKGVVLDYVGTVKTSSPNLSITLSSLSKEIPMKGEDVFLSLGEEFVQCDLISMEAGLKQSEIEQFVTWQMEQKYGSLWREMNAFFQEVREDEKTITVAVSVIREIILNDVRETIEKAEGFPIWLEPDIFAQSSVLNELDNGRKTRVALFEPFDNTIRAVFHDKGQLAALAEFKITEEDIQLETVRGDGEFVEQYMDEFDRYILGEEQNPDVQMFLAGYLPSYAEQFVPEEAIEIMTPVLPFEEEENAGSYAGDGSFSSILGLTQRRITHA